MDGSRFSSSTGAASRSTSSAPTAGSGAAAGTAIAGAAAAATRAMRTVESCMVDTLGRLRSWKKLAGVEESKSTALRVKSRIGCLFYTSNARSLAVYCFHMGAVFARLQSALGALSPVQPARFATPEIRQPLRQQKRHTLACAEKRKCRAYVTLDHPPWAAQSEGWLNAGIRCQGAEIILAWHVCHNRVCTGQEFELDVKRHALMVYNDPCAHQVFLAVKYSCFAPHNLFCGGDRQSTRNI